MRIFNRVRHCLRVSVLFVYAFVVLSLPVAVSSLLIADSVPERVGLDVKFMYLDGHGYTLLYKNGQYVWLCGGFASPYGFRLIHTDCQECVLRRNSPCGWPCEGVISSSYGFRSHPISGYTRFHKGIDIVSGPNTDIRCTACGRVVFSGRLSGYGCVVIVDHGCGYRTVYAHLSKKFVSKGDSVSKGQLVAKMGKSGSATGHHLHYEVQFNGRSINPAPYLHGF